MYYKGNNIGLNYDAATGTWVFNNEPQDFVDTNAFTTADPEFEMAPVVDDEEEEEVQCPEGYIYDNTLKQCVPDPSVQNNYTDTTYNTDYQDRLERENSSVYIPSNETKENWIKNANVTIKEGEGAGKTGYENFVDNLKDRGLIKNEDGKMIFKKDNLGNVLGTAMLSMGGMDGQGEVSAKTNKIIKDLQRMGGINAQINMDDDGNIDFASELELAGTPGTYATYNYDGTDLFGGNYTGFTTPATNPLGVKTFATWDDYMAAIMKPFTSISSQIKNNPNRFTKTTTIGTSEDADKAADRAIKRKQEEEDAFEKKRKVLQDKKDMQQDIKDAEEKRDNTTQDAEERQRRNDQVQKDKDSGYSGSEQDTGSSGSGSSGSGSSYGSGSSEEYDKFEDKQGKPSGGYQRGGHHY